MDRYGGQLMRSMGISVGRLATGNLLCLASSPRAGMKTAHRGPRTRLRLAARAHARVPHGAGQRARRDPVPENARKREVLVRRTLVIALVFAVRLKSPDRRS
jgi:hypothetical protein